MFDIKTITPTFNRTVLFERKKERKNGKHVGEQVHFRGLYIKIYSYNWRVP